MNMLSSWKLFSDLVDLGSSYFFSQISQIIETAVNDDLESTSSNLQPNGLTYDVSKSISSLFSLYFIFLAPSLAIVFISPQSTTRI